MRPNSVSSAQIDDDGELLGGVEIAPTAFRLQRVGSETWGLTGPEVFVGSQRRYALYPIHISLSNILFFFLRYNQHITTSIASFNFKWIVGPRG